MQYRVRLSVLLVSALITISGCATIYRPNPSGQDATLVIGRFYFDDPPPTIARMTRSNIRVTLRVRDNVGHTQTATIARHGTTQFLDTASLAAGDWEIYAIRFEGTSTMRSGRYTWTVKNIVDVDLQAPLDFTIRSGFVNNFGTMRFVFPSPRTISIEMAGDYEELRAYFSNTYRDSGWLAYPWIPTILRYEDVPAESIGSR